MKSRIRFSIIKGYSVQTETELCPINAIMWVWIQSVLSSIILESWLKDLCVFSSFPAQLPHRQGESMHQPCFEMGDRLCPKIKVCFVLPLFYAKGSFKQAVFLKFFFIHIAATKQEKFTRPPRNRKKVLFLSKERRTVYLRIYVSDSRYDFSQ